jgi:1,4-alpha-glucan branching enzyme
MGFTHIEFLPITEHPFDPSWGYQTTGLFAPPRASAIPKGFARFVDGAHKRRASASSSTGCRRISRPTRTAWPFRRHGALRARRPAPGLPSRLEHAIYNFGRNEVVEFPVNNALYWAEKFHHRRLRVDAVASMLYLDYSRKEGEWIPNKYGGARTSRPSTSCSA